MSQAGPRACVREGVHSCSYVGRTKQPPRSSRCWLRKMHLVSALGGKEGKGTEQELTQAGPGK